MKTNLIKLTLEFNFPTVHTLKNILEIVKKVNYPSVKINLESITNFKHNNTELSNDTINIISYNDPNKIIKFIENNIKKN
jgi:hypothetical protein